jgi:hypothetical protein
MQRDATDRIGGHSLAGFIRNGFDETNDMVTAVVVHPRPFTDQRIAVPNSSACPT